MRNTPGWALPALAVSAGVIVCAQAPAPPPAPSSPSSSSPSSAPPLQSQSPVPGDIRAFRSHVEVISVTATVLDTNGKLVTDLPKEAFEIYEDGVKRPVSAIHARTRAGQPRRAARLSDSMFGQRIVDARAAVQQFLSNGSTVRRILRDVVQPPAEGADAMDHDRRTSCGAARSAEAVRRHGDLRRDRCGAAAARTARAKPRAALLVISDGADTASDTSLQTCARRCCAATCSSTPSRSTRRAARPINTRVNVAALREITERERRPHRGGARQQRSCRPPPPGSPRS